MLSVFRPNTRIAASLLAIGMAAAGLSGCTRASTQPVRAERGGEAGNNPAPVTILPHPALTQVGGSVSVADIAERALPAVVNVSLKKMSHVPAGGFMFPFFDGPGGEERQEQGAGSGVIVSADGYVVTANHVVSDASEIKVTTSDRREFDAEVVGTDPKTDLAVIKLKGKVSGLMPIELGDSSRLRLGDVVLAIGNPFNVGQTVTMGIVSAKGRSELGIYGGGGYEDFIQTDAAINPGNSGGALVNMEGKLVGINTAILSRSGGYQGVGFAIPTSMVSPIFESLRKYGKVTRGWLGVSIQDVDQDLVQAMKLPVAHGVIIADVVPGTPAANAGLHRGDVVTKVDGHDIDTAARFRNTIAATGVARKVALEVVRDGQTRTINAELGAMPNEDAPDRPAARPGNLPSARPQGGALDGITLGELTPEARREFEIKNVQKGVVVTDVQQRSPAAHAGLRPGDVLLELNRAPISSVADFQAAYAKAKDSLLVTLHRHGATLFVVVKR
ncbi:MAG TPA: DegQ family serine endoprotease [Polyangiaceae bacterium]|jgi:serine protease Do|nr:DegQ family serine endoprotease [Polyangiaceae bacterium]